MIDRLIKTLIKGEVEKRGWKVVNRKIKLLSCDKMSESERQCFKGRGKCFV